MRQTIRLLLVVLLAAVLATGPAIAGVYILSTVVENDVIVHVTGYDGTGGNLPMSVCVTPGSPLVGQFEVALQNAIDTLNGLQPTVGNVTQGAANNVPPTAVDFESSVLFIMTNCLGLDDPNDFGSFTSAGLGPNGSRDEDAGADLVEGSGDDLRGDDVNVHWFNLAANNPFVLFEPVDGTTYSRDPALLPGGDTFSTNANLGTAALFGLPPTDTTANWWSIPDDARRSLTADDVAMLRLAMAGLDEIEGTADDYTFTLSYIGEGTGCNIEITFDAGGPIGSSSRSITPLAPSHRVLGGSCHYSMGGEWVNWFFNTASCAESLPLNADTWTLISLPCSVDGSSTVQDVFGDDLDPADYGVRWGLFSRDEVGGAYNLLSLTDTVAPGEGYWIKTLDPGQSITVGGSGNLVVDVPLVPGPDGVQNLVGHPFDFDVCWADAEVVVGASTVLSLDQADPLIGLTRACDMVPPDPSCVMSRVAHKWNGAAYEAFDGETSFLQGTLRPFDGFWVQAFQPDVKLRIPAIAGLSCDQCVPQPVADTGGDTTICAGDTVTLGQPPLAGHTYLWSPGGETTAQIDVSPLATTTYTVTATTACGSTQDSATVTVTAALPGSVSDDFEGDVSPWTTTGLWHLVDNSACAAPAYASPTHAFYYGQDFSCNYNTGAANTGTLTSAPITGIDASSELSFQYIRDAETGSYDVTTVEIVTAGGTTEVLRLSSNTSVWTSSGAISLAAFAGETLQVQFRLNTVDSIANSTLGWMIDDVVVTTSAACTPPPSCVPPAFDFEGDNSPWTASGMWHAADNSGCFTPEPGYSSPTHAFYYGQDALCNFDNGATNAGTLTSPPITGVDASSELSFQFVRDAENGGFYDRSYVEVVTGSGTTLIDQITVDALTWTTAGPYSLAAFAGETLQVQLRMDTVDAAANTGRGWMVDDVVVTGADVCTSVTTGPAAEPPVKAGAKPRDWSVRLIAESGTLRDAGNILGQLADSADGFDRHDLVEPEPFGSRYLSIVFPHPDWGEHAGDYTSDYREPRPPFGDDWRFDVLGSGFGRAVTLRWEGHGTPLRGFWLIDEETGERVRVEPGGSYTFLMSDPGRRSFRWVHGNPH